MRGKVAIIENGDATRLRFEKIVMSCLRSSDTGESSDVRRLIEEYPLAWVIGACGDEASLLPMLGVFDADDRVSELIGHFALSNPLGEVFKRNPEATILFKGPDGYISPSQAGRRDWAPTWNYAQVRIQAEVTVEPEMTACFVDHLVEHIERHMPNPWSAAELGERYNLLMPRIVGFRARVARISATFKLGQSETLETLQSILANLPQGELVSWMRRFNAQRQAALGDNDV